MAEPQQGVGEMPNIASTQRPFGHAFPLVPAAVAQ